MTHFTNCFTEAEIKAEYRRLALKLHPDVGGTDAEFRDLQEQYELALKIAGKVVLLPEIFKTDREYKYKMGWYKIAYLNRDSHWYHFRLDGGGLLQVDVDYIGLITEQNKYI